MTSLLRTRAPAKVNLTLRILGVRPNGYHDLESLVGFTGWGDVLTFAPNSLKTDIFTLSIEGPFQSSLGANDDNLILKAASRFEAHFPRIGGGHFSLVKYLPVAAGIGGGSSDAAAALRLLAHISGVALNHPDLLKLACDLGADVPVCLSPGFQRMEGLGEQLTFLGSGFFLYAVLVNPRLPLSTASVFQAFDCADSGASLRMSSTEESSDLMTAILQGENSLENVAQMLCPSVTESLRLLRACEGCFLARMSGSGPTAWGLFSGRHQAVRAAKFIQSVCPEWWVRSCLLR